MSEENNGQKKKGFFAKLVENLGKTRDSIAEGLESVFTASDIDEEFYESLEEFLIMGDFGIETTEELMDQLRDRVIEHNIRNTKALKRELIDLLAESLEHDSESETYPKVILLVGVNGVGKTTTAGKLATYYANNGKKVILAGCDTYRAAATEQLEVWSERAGCDIIKGKDGSDPGSVLFDAISAFKARSGDVLIVDTAGRLHNKKNLMSELEKLRRIVDRELGEGRIDALVVLDGTTGQNALAQAKEFDEATKLTGIIITKLDGTAKGGIALAIHKQLNVPIKFVGVGEKVDDLQEFFPKEFVSALFNKEPIELDDGF